MRMGRRVWPEALKVISAGSFQSPEKFLVWTALAVPLLPGGLDRLTADPRVRRRAAMLAVIRGCDAVTIALVLRQSDVLPAPPPPRGPSRQEPGPWRIPSPADGVGRLAADPPLCS